MADAMDDSLEQRRKHLQAELATQRALVAQRLMPKAGEAAPQARGIFATVSPAYPRSLTMRLAQRRPLLAVGLAALGAALLLRGRREQLDGILSMAKAVEPLFSAAETEIP